ncbi:ABC transporter permease [Pseudothermotoga sp. U03pept]|uniref:ABC transporter permease n=1 Tax=Pseudothermotoga sp. U03pept TaxID=3447012 RepID=UPI003EFC989D
MSEIFEISVRSIYVSTMATFTAVLVAVPLALLVDFFSFRLKKLIILVFQTLTGIPPVLVGLLVYLLLSRSGPLGELELLFTRGAMIFTQFLIAVPIVFSVSYSHLSAVDERIRLIMKTLGASSVQTMMGILRESSFGVMSSILTAFGRVIGEVGAVMIVGGNIAGRTRVLTTSIVLYTSMGRFEEAIFCGVILLIIAFTVNLVTTTISTLLRSKRWYTK